MCNVCKGNEIMKYLIGLLIILFILSCKEDTYEPELFGGIQGSVYDSESGLALSGVSISTTPPTNAVQTLDDGSYKIESIPIGSYTISAKKSGYVKENIAISVATDANTEAIIFLDVSTDANRPPTEPIVISPADCSIDQTTGLKLSWTASDPNANDSLFYDIYIRESGQLADELIASSISDTSYVLENLKFGTSYLWYVVVEDQEGSSVRGDIWSFSTLPIPANPIVASIKIDGNYDVYSFNEEGNSLVKLTGFPGNEIWPRFSPNKTYVAYTAIDNFESKIFIMNYDGSNNRKISPLPISSYHNNGFGFTWTPESEAVIFCHYNKLYKVNNDGSGLKLLLTAPDGRHFRECDYSPIEERLVVLTIGNEIFDSEIYTIDLMDNSFTLLIDNQPGITERPSFSVDGHSIVYTHDASGFESPTGRQLNSRIYKIDLATGATVDVSINKPNGSNDTNPVYSSNGSEIIFNQSQNDGSGDPELWIMNLDGRNRRKILDNAIMPHWK